MFIILTQALFAALFAAGLCTTFNVVFFAAGKKNKNVSFSQTAAKAKRMRINAETTLTRYEKFVIRVESLLKKMDKGKSYLYRIAATCFIACTVTGYICFQGIFLSLVTGLAFVPLTYLYLLFRTQEATREDLAQLQSTMAIITNAYMASNNIIKAVEVYISEKNKYADEKLRTVSVFEEFVSECIYINPNIERNLERLAVKLSNHYFDQWVRNLRLCLGNREMRFSLQPVVDAMMDEKVMQIESDAAMAKTWQTFISTVAVMFAVILVMRIAREEWYLILTNTAGGQIIILLMLASALISSIFVMRINKPVSTI